MQARLLLKISVSRDESAVVLSIDDRAPLAAREEDTPHGGSIWNCRQTDLTRKRAIMRKFYRHKCEDA